MNKIGKCMNKIAIGKDMNTNAISIAIGSAIGKDMNANAIAIMICRMK